MRAGQVRLPIRAWRMAPRISFAPKNPHPHAMSKRHQHTAQRNPFATDGSHPTTHAAELRSIVCFWFSFKSGVYVAARSGSGGKKPDCRCALHTLRVKLATPPIQCCVPRAVPHVESSHRLRHCWVKFLEEINRTRTGRFHSSLNFLARTYRPQH